MKKSLLLLVLPLVFLLTGCPYNSKIPLSVPKTPIDRALVGEWKSNEEPNDSSSMKVFEFNSKEYFILIVDKSDNKTTVDAYRAYLSPVAGRNLLNLENMKAKGEFSFCSYTLEGNSLKIKMVSDVSVKEKYESSKTMKKAFAKKIVMPDFFENELVFFRKK